MKKLKCLFFPEAVFLIVACSALCVGFPILAILGIKSESLAFEEGLYWFSLAISLSLLFLCLVLGLLTENSRYMSKIILDGDRVRLVCFGKTKTCIKWENIVEAEVVQQTAPLNEKYRTKRNYIVLSSAPLTYNERLNSFDLMFRGDERIVCIEYSEKRWQTVNRLLKEKSPMSQGDETKVGTVYDMTNYTCRALCFVVTVIAVGLLLQTAALDLGWVFYTLFCPVIAGSCFLLWKAFGLNGHRILLDDKAAYCRRFLKTKRISVSKVRCIKKGETCLYELYDDSNEPSEKSCKKPNMCIRFPDSDVNRAILIRLGYLGIENTRDGTVC